jgi:transposase
LVKEGRELNFKQLNTVINRIPINCNNILNYFENRSTNTSAESFNAKIKAFKAQFSGVKNKEYILFRLINIYA